MKLGPYELGYNDSPECGIYHGDARELSKAIPDESVDLIFTDPVYDRIEDYEWLAETAARVLKPDGKLLVWQATPQLAATMKAMEPPLNYAWTLHWQRYGPMTPGRAGICVITHCHWFDKGRSKLTKRIADWYPTANGGKNARTHAWGKPEAVVLKWAHALSPADGTTFDPFTGGGTVPAVCKQLQRNYLAFEIDAETVTLARDRVRNTQPPLFVPENEQMELFE